MHGLISNVPVASESTPSLADALAHGIMVWLFMYVCVARMEEEAEEKAGEAEVDGNEGERSEALYEQGPLTGQQQHDQKQQGPRL